MQPHLFMTADAASHCNPIIHIFPFGSFFTPATLPLSEYEPQILVDLTQHFYHKIPSLSSIVKADVFLERLYVTIFCRAKQSLRLTSRPPSNRCIAGCHWIRAAGDTLALPFFCMGKSILLTIEGPYKGDIPWISETCYWVGHKLPNRPKTISSQGVMYWNNSTMLTSLHATKQFNINGGQSFNHLNWWKRTQLNLWYDFISTPSAIVSEVASYIWAVTGGGGPPTWRWSNRPCG